MNEKIILEQVKNIVFDLGGVILNIDYNKPAKAFKELGVNDFSNLYSKAAQDNIFNKLETGMITQQVFFDEIRNITNLVLSNEKIEHAWNTIILDFPVERIKLLESLKNNYRTFLLSNTNIIHYHYYNDLFNKQYGYNKLDDIFEKAYYSHEVGLRKPGKEIYEYVLEDSKLNPKETLFFDDSVPNIESAGELGIKTFLITEEETITKVLNEFGFIDRVFKNFGDDILGFV